MARTSDEEALLELIRTQAVIYGHRVLASGKTSHYYIDGKEVTLTARGAYLVGRCFWNRMRLLAPTAVGGPTLGADPIIGAVLAEAGREGERLGGFIVRKEAKDHGTTKLVEGPRFPIASRVVLVEDVITTGGSVVKAVHAVEALGATVVQIVCLVDRDQGARETLAPYNYTPLFSKADLNIKDASQV